MRHGKYHEKTAVLGSIVTVLSLLPQPIGLLAKPENLGRTIPHYGSIECKTSLSNVCTFGS